MENQGVSSFFHDKGVLITGVTGFLAKVLLEKLLYSCQGIKVIYVLIRRKGAKAGGPVNEDRLKELLKSKIFDRIRDKRPEVLSKIVPVWGDIIEPELGLSDSDQDLLIRDVSIVFHSAANTKFNEPLKAAIAINLLGTKNVFELFQNLQNKDAFVHISTAFCNCQKTFVEEFVYPCLVTPKFLIESYKNLEKNALDSLFESISEGRPNTYTFTKAMAELYLQDNANGLPVSIVRPSIVLNSIKEPTEGWIDTKSLFTNTLHAISLGLIHCIPCNGENNLDLIPADLVCNLSIAAAWGLRNHRSNEGKIVVYNCVSGCDNPMTFNEFQEWSISYGSRQPSTIQVAYPYIIFSQNPVIVAFTQYYHHYLPAVTLDALRYLKGKRPKYLTLYQRFFAALPLKAFFISRKFTFANENVHALMKELGPDDREAYNFSAKSYTWHNYLTTLFQYNREFFYPGESVKYDPVKAKKHVRKLYWRMVFFNSMLAVGVTATVILPIYNSLTYFGQL